MGTVAAMEAAAAGRLHGLVLLGADPLTDLPDRDLARRALGGAGFTVVVDSFLSASAAKADVVLPAAMFAERSGTTTNLEGRITRLGQKIVPPGVSWSDWMIAAELASAMGSDLGFETLEQLWDEIERVAPSHHGVTRAHLGSRDHRDGVVVPLPAGASAGPEAGVVPDTGTGATAATAAGVIDPAADPGIDAVESQGVPAMAIDPTAVEESDAAAAAEAGDSPADGEPSAADPAPPRPPLLSVDSVDTAPAAPALDAYSLRLVAPRRLYDMGAYTQHSRSLAGLAAAARLRVNPYDLDRLGVTTGGHVRVSSARTAMTLEVEADGGVPRGSASLPFNVAGEGAADLIDATAPVTDVRVETV